MPRKLTVNRSHIRDTIYRPRKINLITDHPFVPSRFVHFYRRYLSHTYFPSASHSRFRQINAMTFGDTVASYTLLRDLTEVRPVISFVEILSRNLYGRLVEICRGNR